MKPFWENIDHISYVGATDSLADDGGVDRFFKIANDRRSVRKYDKTKLVDYKVIEKCIQAAGNKLKNSVLKKFCIDVF